jgi:hypothetical protein
MDVFSGSYTGTRGIWRHSSRSSHSKRCVIDTLVAVLSPVCWQIHDHMHGLMITSLRLDWP